MANKGRIGAVPQGDWMNSKAYKMLDWVAFDGGSFLAVTSTLAGESPITHPAKWMQTAKQGNPGAASSGPTGAYIPKGSVANFAALPTTGNLEGHVYNLLDTGDNYVWVLNLNNTGNAGWDKLSGTVDLTNYQLKLVSGTNVKTINGQSLLGAGNIEVATDINQTKITTSTNITLNTLGEGNLSQNGRNVIIDNGVNDITLTCEPSISANFMASYTVVGVGKVTLVGSGIAVVDVYGLNRISQGSPGRSFTLERFGNSLYLKINNA